MHYSLQKDWVTSSETGLPELIPYIGCAGWAISSAAKDAFPESGTHLERYARVLPCVEINSSFYRIHKEETYMRWYDSVPENFRFSVKVPRTITHYKRLQDCEDEIAVFMAGTARLHEKLGCLLVQLPPSFQYAEHQVKSFFETLRNLTAVDIVCEPRHPSWFTLEAVGLLDKFSIAYVEADPQIVMNIPSGKYKDILYVRLHGSPVIYHSSYSTDFLNNLSLRLAREKDAGLRTWCIFDNTASGAALENALWVNKAVSKVTEQVQGQQSQYPLNG